MTLILDTYNTRNILGRVIKEAKKYIVIIVPSLRIDEDVRESLNGIVSKGVKLFVLHDGSDVDESTLEWLKGLENSNIAKLPQLHTRVYLTENAIVMTSMDLYGPTDAQDLGVMFDVRIEKQNFKEALENAIRILDISEKEHGEWDLSELNNTVKGLAFLRLNRPAEPGKRNTAPTANPTRFYCIKCSRDVPAETGLVYCERCLKRWVKSSDMDYVEISGYCHICSGSCRTSAKKPVCIDCYYRNIDLVESKIKNMRELADKM